MILGVGTDIIEVRRIQKLIEKYQTKILKRLFTEHEQAYCYEHQNPYFRFAGRFAAKEAVVKALGTGFGLIKWRDIEICNDAQGKPYVNLSSSLMELFGAIQIVISISHCHEYATAVAICSKL